MVIQKIEDMETGLQNFSRAIISVIGSMVSAALIDIAPMLLILWILVAVDFVTARRLGRRLARKGLIEPDQARLSSRKLGRLVVSLGEIFVVLLLSSLADRAIFCLHGFATLPYVASFLTVWQAVSVLENEAASNPSSWAALARRLVIDKAKRYVRK